MPGRDKHVRIWEAHWEEIEAFGEHFRGLKHVTSIHLICGSRDEKLCSITFKT